MERGKARYVEIAAGSNTTIKTTPGTIYGVHAFGTTQGGAVRIEDGELGASPDLNATASTTILRATSITSNGRDFLDLSPGVGFGKLTIAATSNTRVVAVYE